MTRKPLSERVEEIDALYAKATKGEWTGKVLSADTVEVICKSGVVIGWTGFDSCDMPKEEWASNVRLIAALKNAWPEIRKELAPPESPAEQTT